jgi:hypothetical protein
MGAAGEDFMFGFGSLLHRATGGAPPAGAAVPCRLLGHRRRWDVAMDNTRTIPGYKYYVDPRTRERPPVFVTFLNIHPDPGRHVNGVVFPAGAATLATLDARERSYSRCDVTEQIDGAFGGRVWAYVGRPEARRRFDTGLRTGRAVVSRAYADGVRSGFESFGADMLEEFGRTTDEPEVPLRDLLQLPVPVGPGDRLRAVEGGS